ncbi:hypothetical protein M1145_03140 [Patescibacteria group bacterium]|nr:hypothetical protein [Patescibacteria group bacterium]
MQLIFKLGKIPVLSIAEIITVLKSRNLSYDIINANRYFLHLKINNNIYPDILLNILGGTREIFKVDTIVPTKEARRIKKQFKFNLDNSTTALGFAITESIKSYKEREFKKPYSDIKNRMIPVKLAKIMVNLGIQDDTTAIYDPFCGTGTIITEAILQGLNVYGSDINTQQVKGTIKNIEWIRDQYNLDKNIQFEIFEHNATTMPDKLKAKDDNISIVTEPYLGELWTSKINKGTKNLKTIAKVDKSIEKSIKSISKILKKHQRLVIIIPAFRMKHETMYLKVRDKEFVGLTKIPFISDIITFENKELSDIMSIMYKRRNALILREIFIFEKI